MLAHGILAHVLPEADSAEVLAALIALMPGDQAIDDLLRLAALLAGGGPRAATAVSDRLRLSRARRERLRALLDTDTAVGINLAPARLRQVLYRLGPGPVRDRLLLDAARHHAAGETGAGDHLAQALAEVARWRPVSFPLSGRDARALGIAEGPEVGRLLAAVESWWMAEDFQPGREACLTRLRVLSQSGV